MPLAFLRFSRLLQADSDSEAESVTTVPYQTAPQVPDLTARI